MPTKTAQPLYSFSDDDIDTGYYLDGDGNIKFCVGGMNVELDDQGKKDSKKVLEDNYDRAMKGI